jgi:hypothetical protein
LINLHMPNDFFCSTWLLFLISRAFQPLPIIVLGVYHFLVSNFFSFMFSFDILCYNLVCKHFPFHVHVQMPFMWIQQAPSAIHGPFTRPQRPMQSKIQIPCTWAKCDDQLHSVINRGFISLISQPFGDPTCFRTEIITLTKGITNFFPDFRVWNSVTLAEFQSQIP